MMIGRVCATVAVLVLVAAPGSAAVPVPAVSVVGSANVTFPDFPGPGETTIERVIVSARILPSGQPAGSMLSISPFGFNKADVTCIKIVGDTVYVGGPLEPGFNVYLGRPLAQLAFGIRDGAPDVVASAIFGRADVNTCDVLSAFPPIFVASQGNFVVSGA